MQRLPTRRRGDPTEPEYFSAGTFLLVALVVLIAILAILASFVTAGIGGLLVAALAAIVIGVPMAIRKMRRPADNPRSVEQEAERERSPDAAALRH